MARGPRFVPSLLLAALLVMNTAAADEAVAPPVLTDATFDALLAEVLPEADECAFEEIPWRASFWQAVTEANAADRPVLLWAMNGHPLACT